ncbi:hypothetical protein [Pendulispora albinea]|uniref:Mannosyltransferase n=1 Tax=Pendulispora albinea TaxID=2741071 RepID=A0ABZ2LQM8_9BACT
MIPRAWPRAPFARDALHALVLFVASFFLFQIWVHRAFQGHYWGPFLPGSHFGLPAREAAAFGIFPTSDYGWDAQFYYYQSNDLFATHDSAAHSDNAPYRYQRIGVPLAAWAVSRALGFSLTPPILYHLVQFGFFALGFFFLVRFLRQHGVSVFYAYGWALSAGVVNCLAYGMPDPVGDALFIIAAVACLERRLWLYVPAAVLLVLVREAYVVFAFGVFVLTLAKRLDWGRHRRLLQLAVVGLPGAVFLAWRKYVTLRFGVSPSQSTKGDPLLDWPFLGPWKSFGKALASMNRDEIVSVPLAVVILVAMTFVILHHRKRFAIGYALLPYVLLLWGLGTTVWDDAQGYMKALGTPLAAGAMCLAYTKSRWLKGLLVVAAVHGVVLNYRLKDIKLYLEWPHAFSVASGAKSNEKALTPFAWTLSGLPKSEIWEDYSGIFSWCHRSVRNVRVHVRNEGPEPWHVLPYYGMHAVVFSSRWFDASGRHLYPYEVRTPLGQEVSPGAEADLRAAVQVPPPGRYTLRITLFQEGNDESFHDSSESSYDMAVEVR